MDSTIVFAKRVVCYAFIFSSSTLAAQVRSEDTVSIDAISERYEATYSAIETLAIAYSESLQPVVAEEDLFRHWNMIPTGASHFEAVMHRDGRLFARVQSLSERVAADVTTALRDEFPVLRTDTMKLFTDVPYRTVQSTLVRLEPVPHSQVFVYDGTDIYQHAEGESLESFRHGSRPTFIKIDSTRYKDRFLPRLLWDELLLCSEVTLASELKHRRRNRVPAVFESGEFRVLDERELVAGQACVVVESSDHRFCLDVDHGFAVRRRQWMRAGLPTYEVVTRRLKEVLPNIWFPTEVEKTTYGVRGQEPDEYTAKPAFRVLCEVQSIEANRQDHLALLAIEPPAGSMVIDQTLATQDAQSPSDSKAGGARVIPSISYIVPADKSKLDEVIDRARQGNDLGEMQVQPRSSAWSWLVLLNAALLGVICVIVMVRRSRRRADSVPKT
ncbi:MAG: hypothetical protein ACK5Q5_20305 [Planctomycetaceae bacterium]